MPGPCARPRARSPRRSARRAGSSDSGREDELAPSPARCDEVVQRDRDRRERERREEEPCVPRPANPTARRCRAVRRDDACRHCLKTGVLVKSCGGRRTVNTIGACTKPRQGSSSRSGSRTRWRAATATSTARRSCTPARASAWRARSSTRTRRGGTRTSGCMQKIYDVEIDLDAARGGRGRARRLRRRARPAGAAADVRGRGRRDVRAAARTSSAVGTRSSTSSRASARPSACSRPSTDASRRRALPTRARAAAPWSARMRSRSSVASPLSSHVSVIAGSPANAGWPRNVASPSPISPSADELVPVAVRAERRLRVVHVQDAERGRARSARRDPRAPRRAPSGRRRRRRTPTSGTSRGRAPSRGWRSDRVGERRELGDRAADRAARAGGVLHAQPEVVGRQLEELAQRRRDELDGLVEAVAEVRADVEDDASAPIASAVSIVARSAASEFSRTAASRLARLTR